MVFRADLARTLPNPTYLIVNADEMEPGTFKDRLLLERNPHQLIEGAIVSEASRSKLTSRTSFCAENTRWPRNGFQRAIAEAYERHYLGKNILGSGYSLELASAPQRRPLYMR